MKENISILHLSELKLDRKCFESTSPELTDYFQRYASQDEKKSLSKCYVMCSESEIIGYYTLSASSVKINLLPESVRKKVGYSELPVAVLGRLAVNRRFLGQGFGSVLVFDAIKRIEQSSIAIAALVVLAKDEAVSEFYKRLSFIPFDDAINGSSKQGFYYPTSKIFNSIKV